MELYACNPGNQPVGDFGRQQPGDGVIVSLFSPAAYNIETFVELGNHFRYIRRVVLQVGVDCNDNFASCMGEAGAKGRGLAEILAKANDPDSGVGLLQLS